LKFHLITSLRRFTLGHAGVVALLCVFFAEQPSSFAATSDLKPAVLRALEKLDATNLDNDWFFTMEVVDGEETQTIRNDPGRGKYEKRELIRVNGNVPDSQRQSDFRDSEADRVDDLDPEASGYTDMVDARTLKFVENRDGYARWSFVPYIKGMEKSRDQLSGALLLNLATEQIAEIEIINTDVLRPTFSVTVESYRLILKFQPEQGEILLSRLESKAVGSAGFVTSFDKVVEVSFSNYKRAGAR